MQNVNKEVSFKASSVNTQRGKVPWLEWHSLSSEPTPTIHLSPANGLPTACYNEFVSQFRRNYRFTGMDNRGGWLDQPDPHEHWSWVDHADDLIAAIEAQHSEPVIGLGHSIGGTVSLLAAAKRPDLFSKLVIIDAASVPSKMLSHVYHYIPRWLSFRLFKFIKGSHERRRVWPSQRAFLEHYRHHPTYRNFTDQAMRDYALYGLQSRADGQFELGFNPSWESYNFRRVHYLWDALAAVKLPVLVLRAENTYMYTQAQFDHRNRALAKNIQAQVIVQASHLVPLERPFQLAKQIQDWL